MFLLSLPTLLLHGIFGGKCTTVFGAINMLSAFARVGASLCLLPLLAGEICSAGPEWIRRGREKRGTERGGKRGKHQETKVGREDVGREGEARR